MTEISLKPEEAEDDFLKEKKAEVATSSWLSYKYPLGYLVEFCDEQDITHIGDITGYDLKKSKTQRRSDGINNVTIYNNLSVIRVFPQWCEEAELLKQDFHKLVQLPPIGDGQIASDDKLELDEVEHILNYLYKFEYATRRHAVFQLMWHTCIRMWTVMALNLDDYFPRKQQIRIRHRSESDTPLKNKSGAERKVNLGDDVCQVLGDYIDVHRVELTDV